MFLKWLGVSPVTFFELAAQVSHAGVIHSIGDFAKGKFIINQQFLDFLDFLVDKELFYRICSSLQWAILFSIRS